MRSVRGPDLTESIARALQLISHAHPPDFVQALAQAWEREESSSAKAAMAQILVNSRMALLGRRPMCQDTGIVNIFIEIGDQVRLDLDAPLQEVVDRGVRQAYLDPDNPLRASIVADPLFDRRNTEDNTPAMLHVDVTHGDRFKVTAASKGGGSENKARFEVLLPGDRVDDWVVRTVASLGAGWCPPGILGLGVGGTAERAMLMAKQALMEPIDMPRIRASGPRGALEAFRLDLHDRINALGIGAQGLGGITTVLDVKVRTFATHAASLPVALIPNCAATRHVSFELDGSGPATLEPPDSADWPEILLDQAHAASRAVNLDTLTAAETASWRIGETLRLSGRLLTARDAAHRRLVELLARGECPVPLAGRVIYYVGPVTPVGGEAEGPAGPTTASRMDPFMDVMLGHGVLANIGKAERGPAAIAAIRRHRAPYLIGVGGAALLISKAIRASRLVAFPELGMEAVRELEVVDMPVTVAVDVEGRSLHAEGPRAWRTAPSRAGPHLAP